MSESNAAIPSPNPLVRFWRSPGVRWSILLFVALRLGLSGFALAARATLPDVITPDPVLRPYVGMEPETNPWLEPWQRWDTLYYQAIAERGYAAFESSAFAPPLYPLLMRWVGLAVGGNTLFAGLIVSSLAYLAALIYFYRLTRMETDERVARYATVYLALFPTAFFFLAGYAESLLLLSVVAALYHARRHEWLMAGVWAALAPLARVQGFALFPVLAYEVARVWREAGMQRVMAILGLTLAGVGLVAFPVYGWLALGKSPAQIMTMHSGRFRGRFTIPGVAIFVATGLLISGRFLQADYFDLGFCLLFVGLTALALRWLPAVYGVYSLLMLALILTKVSDFEALLSVSRYVLALFPGFIVLGRLGASRAWVHRLIVYPSIVGLLYLTGQFVIWGWVA
ncbi:MAG: hypothetical protein A2Z37_12130 [Chloroflexi bacterium RBG_19FT_COMBO_62_14]|nr:MAG: hypothetical protein A2Z37_12130 [Chloroflexi bacterium RBG_19FT_COMBO_62_14]